MMVTFASFPRRAWERGECPAAGARHRVALTGPPQPLGAGGRHLAMRLTQHDTTLRAVAFGRDDWADPLGVLQDPLDVAFRPTINCFHGRRNVELHLVDWRPSAR